MLALYLAGAFPAFAQFAVPSGGDRIYPDDQLEIRITEWLPAQGIFRTWDAIVGPYTVGPNQEIAIPFVGQVSTADRSPETLAVELADAFYRQLSLVAPPSVSVGFVERTGVYVAGGVQTPGLVDYDGTLTAQKAIAAAGGYYRESSGVMRLERDVISAQGAIDLARDRAARSIARLERLRGELNGANDFTVDPAAWQVAVGAEMVEGERALMRIRLESLELKLRSIETVAELARRQLVASQERAANLDRQIALATEELLGVRSLVDRGLAVSGRSFSLELTLADLEGRRIDVDQLALQAELQIGQAERDAVDLRTTFRSQASNELQATRGVLVENMNAIETAERLLNEARVIAPEQILDRDGNLRFEVQIFLTRDTNGTLSRMEVDGGSRLQPGDFLEVQLRRSEERIETTEAAALHSAR